MLRFLFAAALFLYVTAHAATVLEWRTKPVYQLLTDRFSGPTGPCPDLKKYCGGTWKGVTERLDYINGMGFDAIWISPIVDNVEYGEDNEPYHGYHAQNWEKVNAHFGSEEDLLDLIKAAHAKDMLVMIDVVANHVGPFKTTSENEPDISNMYPFNKHSHFHNNTLCSKTSCLACYQGSCTTYGLENYNDPYQLSHCRLACLPDLNQDEPAAPGYDPFVRRYLVDWIANVVKTFGFDGMRVDTVRHVKPESYFWREYKQSSGVFALGEVFDGSAAALKPFMAQLDTVDPSGGGLMSYPMFFTLRDAFKGGDMRLIDRRFDEYLAAGIDVMSMGAFIDNHDNSRFLCGNNDWKLMMNALTFVLLGPGVPIMYQGTEQGDANCMEGTQDQYVRRPLWEKGYDTGADLYTFIAQVNAVRKKFDMGSKPFSNEYSYSQQDFYGFFRPGSPVYVALTNRGTSGGDCIHNIPKGKHPFAPKQALCNQLVAFRASPPQTTVEDDGSLNIYLQYGEAKVFVPCENLSLVEEPI